MAFTPPNPDRDKDGNMQALIKAEQLVQIALVLPAAVFLGWVAGVALDRWLHQHWIYIAGLVVGGIAGLTEAVRQALRAGRDLDRLDRSNRGGKP